MNDDPSALCFRGNVAWLSHDYGADRVCKRCGAELPKWERDETAGKLPFRFFHSQPPQKKVE